MPKPKVKAQIAADPAFGEYLKSNGIFPKPKAKAKKAEKKGGK